MKAFTFLALVGIGASAIYFLDEKKGNKRRAKFRKNVEEALDMAGGYWDEYSPEIRKRASDFSKEFGRRAGEFASDFREKAGVYTKDLGSRAGEVSRDYATRAGELARNGHFHWTPSARMATALGSALAVYSAGRGGFAGTVLRTLSLGMFTRALIASR